MLNLAISLIDHIQYTLIHGPNIPGSYVIIFFTELDFTFTTSQIHNWVSFPLWPSHLILSGAISNCPFLLPSSILDTCWCPSFHLLVSYLFAFHMVHGVIQIRTLEWIAISSSSGPCFVRNFHYGLFILCGPAWHGS